jgi:hypothetical protein
MCRRQRFDSVVERLQSISWGVNFHLETIVWTMDATIGVASARSQRSFTARDDCGRGKVPADGTARHGQQKDR